MRFSVRMRDRGSGWSADDHHAPFIRASHSAPGGLESRMLGILGVAVPIGTPWAMCDDNMRLLWRTASLAVTSQIDLGALVFGVPWAAIRSIG